jgi:hypothetical protein
MLFETTFLISCCRANQVGGTTEIIYLWRATCTYCNVLGLWLLDWVWIGYVDLLHLYTQLVIASNTALSLTYTLYSSPLRTHYGSQSSLVVSWQQICCVIPQQYFDYCLFIRCRGNLFTESLPSNERLLWLRYSGFQASCHNTLELFHQHVL